MKDELRVENSFVPLSLEKYFMQLNRDKCLFNWEWNQLKTFEELYEEVKQFVNRR